MSCWGSRLGVVAIGATYSILGTLFTISPELLEHSPVGFETRGILHHVFHYLILIGGLALTLAVSIRDRVMEIAGLVACGVPTLLNLLALATADAESIGVSLNESVSGMDIAVRLIVLAVIAGRLVEIRNEDR